MSCLCLQMRCCVVPCRSTTTTCPPCFAKSSPASSPYRTSFRKVLSTYLCVCSTSTHSRELSSLCVHYLISLLSPLYILLICASTMHTLGGGEIQIGHRGSEFSAILSRESGRSRLGHLRKNISSLLLREKIHTFK